MKTVLKIQNCYSWLSCPDQKVMTNLWKALRARELGCERSRLYIQRIWDGYTDYFKKESGRFLTGLLPEVQAALDYWKVEYEIIDERNNITFAYKSIDKNFLDQWWPAGKPKFDLYDYQVDHVNAFIKNHRGIISPPTGSGKAQPLDSLIYTPDGPIKMGDVKLGMKVCTPDGGTANIIGIFPQGKKQVYEITFTNGDKVKCCKEHLWMVNETSGDFKNKVVNTEFLIKKLKTNTGKNKHSVSNTKTLNFNTNKIKINPYLMGLLLGDGRFHKSMIGISSADEQILNWIKNNLKRGFELKYDDNYDYYIAKTNNSGKGKTNPYLSAVRHYGLVGKSINKFIPREYKYNSIENRLELIRGLMDTDGTVEKNGHVYLATSSYKLSLDFKEVIESLGFICSITSKIPKYTHKGVKKEGQRAYRVTVSGQDLKCLFKLDRKIDKIKIKSPRKTTRIIKSIEAIDKAECQCILINSPEHLYLTNNCVPTHNTEFLIAALKTLPKNTPTLILANQKSLVEQNYERLGEWGFEKFGRLYDKYEEPNVITCATVQSLHKIEKLLPHIKALFVDEVHNMMSKVPRQYYNKLKNCSVRGAISATWEKFGGRDKSQRFATKGYFGAPLKTNSEVADKTGIVKTALLQKRGTLSASECIFFTVNQPDLQYEIYLDAVTNGIANNWHFHDMVQKLANHVKGRTLILVERIAHGDALQSLLPDALWVAGRDDLETRKEVIEKLSKTNKKNAVAIATQGIFNAGINVQVHNLINAAGGKAEHVIIQRMGRGLRTAGDKSILNYYDFIFNINEYLLKHSHKRVRILKKEGHEVVIKEKFEL